MNSPHIVAAAGSGSTIEYTESRDIMEKEHGMMEARKLREGMSGQRE